MRLKLILFLFLTLFQVTSVLSESNPCPLLTIHGKIAVKGNEPHTYVALTTKQGEEYQLQGPLVEQIRQESQGLILSLSGTILSKKKVFAVPILFKVEEIK